MIFDPVENLEIPVQGAIQKLFLDGNEDILIIKKEFEGQKYIDGKFVIGCRAGPSCDWDNFLHEISHFIELPLHRLLKRPAFGWGFSYGPINEVFGRAFYEPRTDQGVRREARVWAIQYNLSRFLGLKVTIPSLVSSAIYINSWSNWLYKRIPDEETDGYLDREKKGLQLLEKYVQELSGKSEYLASSLLDKYNARIKKLRKS